MLRRLDSPLLVGVLVAILYSVFTVEMLRARDGDVSRFVLAGGEGIKQSEVPPGLTVVDGGYDGVFFYRLALDPFNRSETAFGLKLDNPPYRQQRIGYPLIVWVLSGGGRPLVVPWMLVIVNVMAIGLLGWAAAAYSLHLGVGAFWGFLPALYPGFLLSLSRDLSEITASAILMCGILALAAGQRNASAALLSFAIITRETVLFVLIALAAAWTWERVRRRPPRFAARVFVSPLIVYVLWQLVLRWQWGTLPIRAGAPETVAPFSLWVASLAERMTGEGHHDWIGLKEIAYWFVVAIVITTVLIVRHRFVATEWKIAWLAYLAMAAILPENIWYEDFGFMRVFSDFFMVGTLVLIGARTKVILWPMLVMTGWLWVAVGKSVVLAR